MVCREEEPRATRSGRGPYHVPRLPVSTRCANEDWKTQSVGRERPSVGLYDSSVSLRSPRVSQRRASVGLPDTSLGLRDASARLDESSAAHTQPGATRRVVRVPRPRLDLQFNPTRLRLDGRDGDSMRRDCVWTGHGCVSTRLGSVSAPVNSISPQVSCITTRCYCVSTRLNCVSMHAIVSRRNTIIADRNPILARCGQKTNGPASRRARCPSIAKPQHLIAAQHFMLPSQSSPVRPQRPLKTCRREQIVSRRVRPTRERHLVSA